MLSKQSGAGNRSPARLRSLLLVSAESSQRYLLRSRASVVGKRDVTGARSRLGRSEGDLNRAGGAGSNRATVNARR